jgi:hypothetical protein
MKHILEPATTGRSRCRVCNQAIERGQLRFGERREGFGDAESTCWFHPLCAAYRRPAPLSEVLNAQVEHLRPIIELGLAHPRLQDLNGAERSPTDRARCKHCHKRIEKGAWRLGLTFFAEFRFADSGFVHAACAAAYVGTSDIFERVKHLSGEITAADLEELRAALMSPG